MSPFSFTPHASCHYGLTQICISRSTTTDKAVAVRYGRDEDAERDLSFVLEFPMDGLNRGAMIQFLSQYPGGCL